MSYAELLHRLLEHGVSMSAALAQLRGKGASPAEAAAALAEHAGLALAEAQLLVRRCGAWSVPRVGSADQHLPAEPVGRHGRSGSGAATVLRHLLRQPPARDGKHT